MVQSPEKKQRRLLFLTVNSSYSHSSLALPLLHAACADLTCWEWRRCDMTLESDISSVVREITEQNCDLLATDLYLFNRPVAMNVLERCHALDPACRIAVGGPECLGDGAEELLKQYPWLDCVFRGEGEAIFRSYLENFDLPMPERSRIIPADGNAVLENWAESPCPVLDEFFSVDKPFVQIETSRGCPMNCFYCTSGHTRTRYRTLEQLRRELQLLHHKGVREVRVLDRTFNLPQERGAQILRLFREEFPDMRFHLELHPQFLGEALRKELSNALPNQLHVEVGVQCLDQTVQQLSGRCSDPKPVLDGLGFLCRQTAFATHADLLAGLPGQNWQHILSDTVALMQIKVGEIQLEVLKALPGTQLRSIAPEHGIVFAPSAPYDVMQSNTMSLSDIENARDLSRLLDMTYNHHFLHPAILTVSREYPEFVPDFLNFFHQKSGSRNTVWDLKKRFLFVLDFCKEHQLERSQRQLACQWLLAGFLPGQGPDEYSVKTDSIPPDAQLIDGAADCSDKRETRFWRIELENNILFIACNRSYALNRPAAIWQISAE